MIEPGDLDRMRFALHDGDGETTARVLVRSGLPAKRAAAALAELHRRGEARRVVGHVHENGEFCECLRGENLPREVLWHEVS